MGARKLVLHDRSLGRLSRRERQLVAECLIAEARRRVLSGQKALVFVAERLLGAIRILSERGDNVDGLLTALSSRVVR